MSANTSASTTLPSMNPTVYKLKVTPDELDIIRATLPLVAQAGQKLTQHFYMRLFENYPSLLNVFNRTNQKKGEQPRKLLNTIAAAAKAALATGELPGDAIETICHKHCALNVEAKDYDAVGATLLQTISELLTDDEATLNAWKALYYQIAEAFIQREQEIATKGGAANWKGTHQFRLAAREEVSSVIARLTWEHVVNGNGNTVNDIPDVIAGQYTTVWVPIPAKEGDEVNIRQQPRHYTLALPRSGDKKNSISMSVKRQGLVSGILHEAPIGTVMEFSAPFGCFTLEGMTSLWEKDPDIPIVLLSAGVGITPIIAMLEQCCKMKKQNITWLHCSHNGQTLAYDDRVLELTESSNGAVTRRVWLSRPDPKEDGSPAEVMSSDEYNKAKFHFSGRMNLHAAVEQGQIAREAVLHADNTATQYFMCGPGGWMQSQIENLVGFGVDEARIHIEGF